MNELSQPMDALRPEEVFLAAAKKFKELPSRCRAGENADTCVFGSHEHTYRKRAHQR
jgi:hypothetical protein